jgi:PAS domain S-box-containing protein
MLLTLPQKVLRRIFVPALPGIGAVGLTLAVGAAYFLAAHLSLAFLTEPDGVAVFWPAAGISAGVLIALGRDARWPVAAGVAVATVAANLMSDRSVWLAMTAALCNTGEALLAAFLIEHYFGRDFSLSRLRNVVGLLAAAIAAAAVSGVGGTVAHKLLHTPAARLWTIWLHWFASDAVGLIAVAPLVIAVAEALRTPPSRREFVEGVAATAVLGAMTLAIVSMSPVLWVTLALAALVFPVLLWIAARSQPVFAAAAAFVHSLAIVWTITYRIGYFGDATLSLGDRILIAQTAVLGFGVCAYILAALFAERRRHEAVLEESEARLQEALKAGAVTAFEWNPRSGQSRRSEDAAQIFGLDSQQPLSSAQFLARIHRDDRRAFVATVNGVSIANPTYSATFRFIRPDGREVWLEETGRGEFDAAGRVVRLKGLTRDITGRKRAEERQDLLIAELDHRVKNVLARVAVVAMHTRHGHDTIDDFVKALDGRLQSMCAAHELLSQSSWCGVGLTDLVRRQLAPYTTDANTTISGPDVMLTAAATQALAMVIHELVTNAAKYGALSHPGGRVSVKWEVTGDIARMLKIVWREHGGPPPAAIPAQGSYGSCLIRELIPHELDGAVELAFPAEGVCCEIAFPFEQR